MAFWNKHTLRNSIIFGTIAFGIFLLFRGFRDNDEKITLTGALIIIFSLAIFYLFWRKEHFKSAIAETAAAERAIPQKNKQYCGNEPELKSVLIALDNLLDKLPIAEIEKFARTKEADAYRRIIAKIRKSK